MNVLKSLFTQHLLAKFFALVFAGVTIYLVDRELTVVWFEESMKVVPRKDAPEVANEAYIRLSTDQNVYVAPEDRNKNIRLRIRGSVKDREIFAANPRVDLHAREEWVDRTGGGITERTLTDEDFKVMDVPGATVTVLDDDTSIRLDLIEEVGDIALRLQPPTGPIAGGVYDETKTVIKPAKVRVRGPRNVVKTMRAVDVKLKELGPGASYNARDIYGVELTDAFKRTGVTLVDGPIEVTLGVQAQSDKAIRFEKVPVSWVLPNDILKDVRAGTLEFKTVLSLHTQCDLELLGPPEVVDRIDEAERRRIASELYAILDPSKAILNTRPNEVKNETVVLQVMNVPPGLRVGTVSPNDVLVEIQRQ